MNATASHVEETNRVIAELEKKAAERNDKVVMAMLDAATNTELMEERLVLMSLASMRLDGMSNFVCLVLLNQLRAIGLMMGLNI